MCVCIYIYVCVYVYMYMYIYVIYIKVSSSVRVPRRCAPRTCVLILHHTYVNENQQLKYIRD